MTIFLCGFDNLTLGLSSYEFSGKKFVLNEFLTIFSVVVTWQFSGSSMSNAFMRKFASTIVRWRMWNFLGVQAKFNRFFHSYEHSKRIFVIFYDFLMPRRQKYGTILLNMIPWEWFTFKMSLMKFVLLIWNSHKKIIFRKIKLSSVLQNWHWKLKISNFWHSSIKRSYKVSKNPLWRLIQMQ